MQINKMVDEIIIDVEHVANLFYQESDKLAYIELNRLLGNIQIFMNALYNKEQQSETIYSIMSVLNKVMAAIEEKDAVLIADILLYELSVEIKKCEIN